MGISYVSILAFVVCVLSVFCCLFIAGSTGTVLVVSYVLACITVPLCVVLAILAKRHRKIHDLYGRKLELCTLFISIYTISYIFDSLALNTWLNILIILPFVIYAKSFNKIVYGQPETYSQSKKHWILRPVSWIVTIILMLALQFIAELICSGGERVVIWLGTLPTLAVILLTMAFGSAFLGVITYSLTLLPVLVVTVSDGIYPSNHAFRYYFVGIYEIIGCSLLLYAAVIGAVEGGSMFWFCARYIWLIVVSIIMMVVGRSVANARHDS